MTSPNKNSSPALLSTMRKAISRKGSRRKQSSDVASKSSNSHLSPSNSVQSDHNGDQSQKRKVTEAEALLTAKNYRLAKELSELRVRHREESKNVTRLTMENMNLASRCREAISHVAMLKKELAMHQRRAAEALALQRQQQVQQTKEDESGNSDLVPSVEQMTAEMEQMERIMATHATPKPSEDDGTSPTLRSSGSNSSPTSEFYSDYEEEKQSVSPNAENTSQDIRSQTMSDGFTPKSAFPISASPRVSHKSKNYNEGFPDDLPLSSRKRLSKLIRRTPPGIMETDSETNSSGTLESTSSKDKHKSIVSSIDAFEASFQTSFPVSFDSSQEGQTTSEIYNPFCPSPVREKLESGKKEVSINLSRNNNLVYNQNPSVADSKETKPSLAVDDKSLSPDSKKKYASITSKDPKTSTRQFREPSPSLQSTLTDQSERDETPLPCVEPSHPPAIQRVRSAKSLHEQNEPETPNSRTIQKNENNLEQPERPEKTMSQAARAQYEKALQPRDSVPKRFHGNTNNKYIEQDEPSNSDTGRSRSFRDFQENKFASNTDGTNTVYNYGGKSSNRNLRRLQQGRNEDTAVEEDLQTSRNLSSIRNTYPKSKSPSLSNYLDSNLEAPLGTSDTIQVKDSPTATDKSSSCSPSVSSAISAYENAVKKHREEDTSSKISKSLYRPRSLRSLSPASQVPQSDKKDNNDQVSTPASADEWLDRRRSRADSYDADSARSRIEYLKEQNYITQQKIKEEYDTTEVTNNISHSNFASSGRSVRRSTKQPISYAEPPINSKLRRGDIFFAKEESNENSSEIRKDYLASVVRL